MLGEADEQLIVRVASGDRDAFRALVARQRGPLLRFLRAHAPSEAAAEDALQETLLAVFRGASSFRGEGSGRAWMFGLARRQAARTWRLRAGEPRHPEPLSTLGAAAGWGSNPETLAARVEDRERVLHALATLAPEDKEILVLRDLEQLTGPETAAALGIGLAAMKSRLHRARLRLMARLQEVADG